MVRLSSENYNRIHEMLSNILNYVPHSKKQFVCQGFNGHHIKEYGDNESFAQAFEFHADFMQNEKKYLWCERKIKIRLIHTDDW